MEKYLKFTVVFLLLISIIGFFIMPGHSNGCVYNIYLEGKLYKSINLKEVISPYEISLPHNTILVESDGITVVEADCPDKVCMKRGKMQGGMPIVCAPASLYIQLSEVEVDAVSW